MLCHVFDALFKGNLATRRVLGGDVSLVPNDVQDGVGGEILAQLLQPALHVVEAGGVGDVVTQESGVCAAIVQSRDAAEALLAGRVPQLQANGGVWVVWRVKTLCEEGGADGGGDGAGRGEVVVDEAGK